MMHVVTHDLHLDHQDEHAELLDAHPHHGDHEHPLVSSARPPQPAPSDRVGVPVVVEMAFREAASRPIVELRDSQSHAPGDHTGQQSALSTFLI